MPTSPTLKWLGKAERHTLARQSKRHSQLPASPRGEKGLDTTSKEEMRQQYNEGDFNNPLSMMYRSGRQNINRETLDLNYKLNQIDLTDIYRTFHPTAAEYTFFASTHKTFFMIDHVRLQNES